VKLVTGVQTCALPIFISLLLRFYDVQRGAIRIDGVDIKEMALDDLRRRFGVVLQDPFLFTGTIEGNIRLGSEWIDDAQVRQAARSEERRVGKECSAGR